MSEAYDLQVRRDDLHQTRRVVLPAAEEVTLAEGEVLLKVDVFAFTANNVTYAVAGDMMNYWDFFPAEDGWGRVPVWGFGDVVRSNADGVTVGERFYGYFPMSSYLLVKPARVSAHGFSDASDHRAHLHPVYNSYAAVAGDPGYSPDLEPQQMILRPLFTTSFVLDDFLADNDLFGARRVILSSASSKTTIGLAWMLQRTQGDAVEVVGLTGAGNVGFCEGLGIYDRVLAYDDLEQLDAALPSVSVDMAGNGAVLARLHDHLGDALKFSSLVGITHWGERGGAQAMAGPQPQLFFAPDQIRKRNEDWGAAGFQEKLGAAWQDFVDFAADWMSITRRSGIDAVEDVYRRTLDNAVDPREGQLLSMD